MARVSGFKFDVFISYAHDDNHPDLYPEGWINKLVRAVIAGLKIRGLRDVEIAFDARLGHNASIEELIDWASHSAIFVAIGSPTYVERDWTKREMKAFVANRFDARRFILAEMRPLNAGQVYPDKIDEQNRVAFFHIDELSRQSQTFSPSSDAFVQQAAKLTDALVKSLGEVASLGPAPNKAAKPAVDSDAKTVLLTQQAGGLDEQHENIRYYLNQYNIRVLPEFDYPQGAAAFAAEFASDAARSDICVQLLGARPGLRPRDLPEGYQALQLRLANDAGLYLMQWRSPELQASAIADEQHKSLVFGPGVRAESFEDFKQAVKAKVLAPPPVSRLPVEGKALAFVNTHMDDIEFARAIAEALADEGLSVQMPCFLDSAENNLRDLVEKMEDSEALFFVYRNASQAWLHSQHRRFAKIIRTRQGNATRLVAVCLGPPDARETGIFDRALKLIDLSGGDLAPLHDAVRTSSW